MVAFTCSPSTGERIPDYSLRRKIERQTAKSVHEHIIIYTDFDRTTQIWQWVKRETGKPTACREHTYHINQPGDSLIQKLQSIVFSLEEEETLTIVEVAGRAKAAFDIERITKRFYERFKAEHDALLRFIAGIPDDELQRWYASVMLNRLMFIDFIQNKGFLDNDDNYLRNKLLKSKGHGKDLFYKKFLCPLFFEGFAKKAISRSPEINKLLGKIPYLNGGLFLKHQIEELHGKHIQIADAAFEKLFDFFDQYQWHLDERPLKKDNEINPDVLGYIFEKYINQKQMGAYYTQEDITGSISKNTIIPFIFDAVRKNCKAAFEGMNSIWRLLKNDPDRYVYDSVKLGVIDEKGNIIPESILPDYVQKGMHDPKAPMFDKRYNLGGANLQDDNGNKLSLPTETWREYVERRNRCLELRKKLANGELCNINDFITYNLNILQFTQDVIENCEEPELLRAFWRAIEQLKALDPTCGSGAFIFAVLNILELLYEACLQRMQIFLDELERSGEKHRADKYGDFKQILKRVREHPNPRYFIFKSIIVNNLYGVDIMEEAIEICKLRLFLKLVAQIDKVEDIEPLPDLDFNIRAGNTLVGSASIEEVKQAVTSKLDFENTMERIEEQADDIDRLFKRFQEQQTELGGEVTPEDKQELRKRLKLLEDELNQYLAGEYGVDPSKKAEYNKWLASHKPFHWFIEFYGILKDGGFHVNIGNPPYLEFREVDYIFKNYEAIDTAAIHAICIERSASLLHNNGCMRMIVPLSLVSTRRMKVVQNIIEHNHITWYANFAWRPAKLFDTVNRALTIFIVTPAKTAVAFSTGYLKWTSETRNTLMPLLAYNEVPKNRTAFWVPKLSSPIEFSIFNKMLDSKVPLSRFFSKHGQKVYYRTTGGLYWKVFTDFAPKFSINGKAGHSSRETCFHVAETQQTKQIIALLSSNTFWWWYTLTSNLRDLNPYDIQSFPIPGKALSDGTLGKLGDHYLKDIDRNSLMLVREQKQTGHTETQSFKIQKSKPIIDDIDRVLAKHYGFTDEELDFIINYDIKYRMGRDNEEE